MQPHLQCLVDFQENHMGQIIEHKNVAIRLTESIGSYFKSFAADGFDMQQIGDLIIWTSETAVWTCQLITG